MACVDINECALGTFDCDPNSDCVNQPGTYTCVCHEGYVKSGGKCIDIDECALGTDQCDLHSTCVNTEGMQCSDLHLFIAINLCTFPCLDAHTRSRVSCISGQRLV